MQWGRSQRTSIADLGRTPSSELSRGSMTPIWEPEIGGSMTWICLLFLPSHGFPAAAFAAVKKTRGRYPVTTTLSKHTLRPLSHPYGVQRKKGMNIEKSLLLINRTKPLWTSRELACLFPSQRQKGLDLLKELKWILRELSACQILPFKDHLNDLKHRMMKPN